MQPTVAELYAGPREEKKATESSQEAVFLGFTVSHFKYIFLFYESFLAWNEKTLRVALQNGKKYPITAKTRS